MPDVSESTENETEPQSLADRVLRSVVRSVIFSFLLLILLLLISLVLDRSLGVFGVIATIVTMVVTFIVNVVTFEKPSIAVRQLETFLARALIVVAVASTAIYLVAVRQPVDAQYRIVGVDPKQTTVTDLYPEQPDMNSFDLTVETPEGHDELRMSFVARTANPQAGACAANIGMFVDYNSASLGSADQGENAHSFEKVIPLDGTPTAHVTVRIGMKKQSDPNCAVHVSVTRAELSRSFFPWESV